MGQEFIIKSQQIEDKINQLLPSQGGFQAGVDFSASTTVIPIVDLTETAEGSTLRQDLQTALSLNSATTFNVNNATTTVISTTGYYRVTGGATGKYNSATAEEEAAIIITDGISSKTVWAMQFKSDNVNVGFFENVDYVVYLEAGHSLNIKSSTVNVRFKGSVRQIADINGNLVNP